MYCSSAGGKGGESGSAMARAARIASRVTWFVGQLFYLELFHVFAPTTERKIKKSKNTGKD